MVFKRRGNAKERTSGLEGLRNCSFQKRKWAMKEKKPKKKGGGILGGDGGGGVVNREKKVRQRKFSEKMGGNSVARKVAGFAKNEEGERVY